MNRRRFGFVVLLLVAALGCTHADGTSDGKSPAGKKFRIAMIPKGTSHEFWKSVEAGARKAEKEFGVEIAWKGPTGEGDTGEQIRIVENFLAGGYDGICLAPLDGIALRKPVDEVLANKVPVVIFDSALADPKGITSFVATNNFRAGRARRRLSGRAFGEQRKHHHDALRKKFGEHRGPRTRFSRRDRKIQGHRHSVFGQTQRAERVGLGYARRESAIHVWPATRRHFLPERIDDLGHADGSRKRRGWPAK